MQSFAHQNKQSFGIYFLRLGLAISILFAGFSATMPANAQTGAISLKIEGKCDDANYPTLTCVVTPVDQNGVPIVGLDKNAFEVLDGTTRVADVDVATRVNQDVRIALMLVLDISGSLNPNNQIGLLKSSADKFLENMSPTDSVGLIAFNTKVDIGDVANPKIDITKEYSFTLDKNLIRNTIRNLTAVGGTPLYDALFKAVVLTEKQNIGQRAIIVMTDGKNEGTTIYKADDAIDRAVQRNIPVFAVGFGSSLDESYLQRLTSKTGGTYRRMSDLNKLQEEFANVQNLLKTQYVLKLQGASRADGKSYPLTIRVNTAAGKAEAQTSFVATPPTTPAIRDITVEQKGQNRSLATTNEVQGVVKLKPVVDSRLTIVKAEYDVNGKTERSTLQEPFSYDWNTSNLQPGDYTLTVKTTNSNNPPDVGTRSFNVKVLACNVLCQIESNPGVALGLIAALLLISALMIFFIARNARNRRMVSSAPITGASTVGGTVTGGNVSVGTQSGGFGLPPSSVSGSSSTSFTSGTGGAITGVYNSGAGASPGAAKTMILRPGQPAPGLPIGWLLFTGGDMNGRQHEIKAQEGTTVSIGRETQGNDLVLTSPAVSRQHAKLKVEGGKLFLYDLGSTSGTKVNGALVVGRTELRRGDKIEFADVKAEYKPT